MCEECRTKPYRDTAERIAWAGLLLGAVTCEAGSFVRLEVLEAQQSLDVRTLLVGNLLTFLVLESWLGGLLPLAIAWWRRDLYGWCRKRQLHPALMDRVVQGGVGLQSVSAFLLVLGGLGMLSVWFQAVWVVGVGLAVAVASWVVSSWLVVRLVRLPFGNEWQPIPRSTKLPSGPAVHPDEAAGSCMTTFWGQGDQVRWMRVPGPQFPMVINSGERREKMTKGLKNLVQAGMDPYRSRGIRQRSLLPEVLARSAPGTPESGSPQPVPSEPPPSQSKENRCVDL